MKITNKNLIQNIIPEYESWKEQMYAGKSKEERQKMGQFFTPPALSIKMVEKFSDLTGKALDPTCGAGNLLAAAIFAGFKPENVYGIEIDPDILQIAIERLSLLGVPKDNLHVGDALDPLSYKFK